jgi:hypothetical protein
METTRQAFREGATYLTERQAEQIASGMGQISPVPVDVVNAPPHWIFWLGCFAAVGSFIYNVTKKR